MNIKIITEILLCAVLWFVHPSAVNAQQPQHVGSGDYSKVLVYRHLDNDSILRRFEARFVQLDSLMSAKGEYEPSLSYGSWNIPFDELDSLFEAKGNDEYRAFKRKSGLEITGQIYQRLDNTVGLDEDDGYSSYATKFQGELGWNIFNSSILQRKSEQQRIRLSNVIEKMDMARGMSADQYKVKANEVQMRYNKRLAVVLYNRLMNVDLLNMAYQYTLQNDKISNDKLFEVMDDKMDLEYALMQTDMMDSIQGEPLRLPTSVVLKVDSAMLFSNIDNGNMNLQLAHARAELLGVQSRLTNYMHQMRLTPFVRGSHYLRTNGVGSSTNVDLGVRFTFPLYDDSSAKRKALRTEQTIAKLDVQSTSSNIKSQCRLLLNKLDKLNNTLIAEERHLKQISDFVGIRKVAYDNSSQGYNYIARMEEYNTYLKSVERLYRLMLSRDLCLIEIQRIAGVELPVFVEK